MDVILYSTPDCHLCEQAAELLAVCAPRCPGVRVDEVDIAADDALLERYGERIPVLRDPAGGRELGWPFDADAVLGFLSGAASAEGPA